MTPLAAAHVRRSVILAEPAAGGAENPGFHARPSLFWLARGGRERYRWLAEVIAATRIRAQRT